MLQTTLKGDTTQLRAYFTRPQATCTNHAVPSHTTSIRIDEQAATLRHHARRAQERAELDDGQLEGLEHPTGVRNKGVLAKAE